MAKIDYDDMAYRICNACIRELASKEYHETIKEKIKRTIEDMPEVEPVGNSNKWGKWIISEIRCPICLEYFQADCYSTEELKECPSCGATMKRGQTMTNQQAINILLSLPLQAPSDSELADIQTAVRTAIKALEYIEKTVPKSFDDYLKGGEEE